MNGKMSTTALALHDLGLAAGFGGTLFGKLALDPAVRKVDTEDKRREILKAAWGGYQWVNALSLATVGVTWIVGRSALSGKEAKSRGLTITKDILTGTMVVSGLVSMVASRRISTQPQAEPSNTEGSITTQPAQKLASAVGTVSLLATAGVICVTALLNMRAGRSGTWAVFSRWLP